MPGINDLQADPEAQIQELKRQLAALEAGNSGQISGVPPQPATPRRRKQKKGIQYLTDQETEALARAIEDEGNRQGSLANTARDQALFEVAYKRGLRASEVGLLQLAHLRISHRRLYVTRLKGGISGEFMLTDAEVRFLKGWLKVRGTKPGALFPSRNHRAISRRRLDELMKFYGAIAGLPIEKRHFHSLRHSCATALLERDVDITEVQDHLGHTDIRNTMIYAKVTNRKRQKKDEGLRQW